MKKLIDTIFLLDVNDYVPLGYPFRLNAILFFLALGLIAACIILSFYKASSMLLLRRLIRREVFDAERAKTLAELGIRPKLFVRKTLSESGRVSRMIHRTDAGAGAIDFSTARFYLAREDADAAEALCLRDKTSPIGTALLVLLILGFYLAIAFLMPSILSLVASMF